MKLVAIAFLVFACGQISSARADEPVQDNGQSIALQDLEKVRQRVVGSGDPDEKSVEIASRLYRAIENERRAKKVKARAVAPACHAKGCIFRIESTAGGGVHDVERAARSSRAVDLWPGAMYWSPVFRKEEGKNKGQFHMEIVLFQPE